MANDFTMAVTRVKKLLTLVYIILAIGPEYFAIHRKVKLICIHRNIFNLMN